MPKHQMWQHLAIELDHAITERVARMSNDELRAMIAGSAYAHELSRLNDNQLESVRELYHKWIDYSLANGSG